VCVCVCVCKCVGSYVITAGELEIETDRQTDRQIDRWRWRERIMIIVSHQNRLVKKYVLRIGGLSVV